MRTTRKRPKTRFPHSRRLKGAETCECRRCRAWFYSSQPDLIKPQYRARNDDLAAGQATICATVTQEADAVDLALGVPDYYDDWDDYDSGWHQEYEPEDLPAGVKVIDWWGVTTQMGHVPSQAAEHFWGMDLRLEDNWP